MSTTVMAACWPLQMPPTQKAVLISLADNANDQGYCWPSIPKICERTCFGRTAVIAAIKWLEDNGHISIDRASQKVNKYVIHVAKSPVAGETFHYVYRITHKPSGTFYIGLRSTCATPKDDPYWGSGKECAWLATVRQDCSKEILTIMDSREGAAEYETQLLVQAISNPLCLNKRISTPNQAVRKYDSPPREWSVRRTVREADGSGDESYSPPREPQQSASRTSTVREADPNRKEPSLTVSKSNRHKRSAAPTLVLPEWLEADLWMDWIEHRRQGKFPMSEKAEQLAIASLGRLRDQGFDPKNVIENAIELGWRGLFAPKKSKSGEDHANDRSSPRESVAERAARLADEGDERDRQREAAQHRAISHAA